LVLYAISLNVVLFVAMMTFVVRPGFAAPLYMRWIGWGTPQFRDGLLSPSGSGSWSAIFTMATASWLLPLALLLAITFMYRGVRPELASYGIVKLGTQTQTLSDDSTSWWGLTNGFFVGVLILSLLGLLAVNVLTSKEFEDYTRSKDFRELSVGNILDGYKNFVRGAIGAAPPPAAPASAPKGR
jgi:hypothetical protein